MAFQEITITAMEDIIPLVKTFAGARGWTVSGDTITPPVKSGYADEKAVTLVDAQYSTNRAKLILATLSGYKAELFQPQLNGTESVPDRPNPTKLFLFGDSTPEHFIGIVVEFGFNLYRHMYIGRMSRLGNYSGGMVLAAVKAWEDSWSGYHPIHYRSHKYLFNGLSDRTAIDYSGLVDIVHADNGGDTKYPFLIVVGSNTFNSQPDHRALGGFPDTWNDGLLARAKATYAGANLLVPINLLVTAGEDASVRYRPIGYPAGIRMVHMEGLEPGETIEVGGKNWQVFPAITKSSSYTAPRGTAWAASQTSYYVGYAYAKD